MASKTILSKNQQTLLTAIAADKNITQNFYLGGGTALAEFYLHHRFSEDLDFFCEHEFDSFFISTFFKNIQKKLKIKKIDYQQSFNRNLFFVEMRKETIKTEFTYYPFSPIEKGMKIKDLQIDSLFDIAINKVFTIYQKVRSRDFIDLYLIIKKTGWEMDDLIKKAKTKFDYHIDPLQMGTQFLKSVEVEDFPRMIIKLSPTMWQKFFIQEAKKLSQNIFR